MDLAVDTNVVVAAILKQGITRNLVFNSSLSLYSPERLSIELANHEKEFLEKTGLSAEVFREVFALVVSQIQIMPLKEYIAYADVAKKVSPDQDDWPFLAVALSKKCVLWSNDKLLCNQKMVRVYSTQDLLDVLK